MKFVLADRADYLWAKQQILARALTDRVPIVFSPVHDRLDPAELARWVLDDALQVRVQVQLHKVLWPGELRGV